MGRGYRSYLVTSPTSLTVGDILPPRCFPALPERIQSEVAQMHKFACRFLLLAVPMASALAQTPELKVNVVYVCTDGQSFKVFSCDSTTGACDYQNYKKGQAYQRGEALRAQLAACWPH